MPKFEKGSEEAKQYMTELRAKRVNKPKEPKKVNPQKKVKQYFVDNIENQFLSGSTIIQVPEHVLKLNAYGKGKHYDTLTKSGNIRKVQGEPVIKLVTHNEKNIRVKKESKKKLSKEDSLIWVPEY